MRCWVLLVNRNRAKLYKKASYEASVGKIRKHFRENQGFFIPDDSIPIEVENRRSTIPLWVVNEKTLMALGVQTHIEENPDVKTLQNGNGVKELISFREKTDIDAHTKLNLLVKREFWKQVAEKIKLSKMETFIYLCAGYGVIRVIEYVFTAMFTGHG